MKEKLEKIKAALREVLELEEKATPGPWNNCAKGYEIEAHGKTVCEMSTMTSHERDQDAAFIVRARTLAAAAAMSLLIAIETLESVDQCEGIAAFKAEKALQEIINQFED